LLPCDVLQRLISGWPSLRWVALTSGSSTKSNIYKMTIDGSEPLQLTFFEAALSSSPAWCMVTRWATDCVHLRPRRHAEGMA